MVGADVSELARRLQARGYLSNRTVESTEVFDRAIRAAVVQFQRARGLDADGIVGQVTIYALCYN